MAFDSSLYYQFFGSSTGFLSNQVEAGTSKPRYVRQPNEALWRSNSRVGTKHSLEDIPGMLDLVPWFLGEWLSEILGILSLDRYIQAAASPKDLVILLDGSGSMTGLRKQIARYVVENILDTLTDNDYVTVLRVSEKITPVDECFENSMALASDANIRRSDTTHPDGDYFSFGRRTSRSQRDATRYVPELHPRDSRPSRRRRKRDGRAYRRHVSEQSDAARRRVTTRHAVSLHPHPEKTQVGGLYHPNKLGIRTKGQCKWPESNPRDQGQCKRPDFTLRVRGQCKRSRSSMPGVPRSHPKSETHQLGRLFEAKVGSPPFDVKKLTLELFLTLDLPCTFLIDPDAGSNVVPYHLYNMLKIHLPNLSLKKHSPDLQTLNGFTKIIGKLTLLSPLTIGKISRKENFHVVDASLPFGILTVNTLYHIKLKLDYNNGTIFQLGVPLSNPTYHFNHVPNECTYGLCQNMSQRTCITPKSFTHGNPCMHPLNKAQLSTCHKSNHAPHNCFTKSNCHYYMPSTHKATTTSTYNHNAQNMSIQQHSSHNYHTKLISDHTSSRNNHASVYRNKHDIHNNNTQTTSIQQDGFHANNTRVHTSSHNGNTHNQRNKHDTRTKRRQQPANACTTVNNTIVPSTQNIEKIHVTKQPHSRKTLRSFLSAVNAYKKFIPDHTRLRTPLVNLLKRDVMWVWDDECQKTFTSLKKALPQTPHYTFTRKVYCNASILGIAGVLKQVYPDGKTYTVQYFSHSLRTHEQSYSNLELQCLAIVESVDNFRACLMGRKFTILSNHPALQWLKGIKAPSGRLFRWRLRLSRYEYEVRSINGVQQYETGVLTRIPFCGLLDASLIKSHQSSPSGKSCVTMDHNGLHTVSRKGVYLKL
ncbi:K02A2.6-like [Cordylochernes scorpioides]|uniref:RNA-directed DNA polymerase n=1 Tax=Cordylochernes scorpioides TaxID=51811 RepID=A0ABY6KF25_9ARAC|nr:K02A2.6-like [Cordylochernes scorpioides]